MRLEKKNKHSESNDDGYRSLQDRHWELKIEEETYRWLVCSWSLLSCAGCEPERRNRQMAWRAATSRANPWRATLGSATRAFSPAINKSRANNDRIPTQCSLYDQEDGNKEQDRKKYNQQVTGWWNQKDPISTTSERRLWRSRLRYTVKLNSAILSTNH